MKPLILQQKAEVFLDFIYPIIKKFPQAEKFCLCQEIKQACYTVIKNSMLANNVKNNRVMYLREVDANLKLLLVLFKVANSQRYVTDKKLHELQTKIIELGKITGGLLKRY